MDKKQFFYLLNNALKITLDDNSDHIFYVWNKSIERQLKYNSLFNLPIKYNFNKKDILFKQDQKNKILWYDYNNILLKLKKNSEYKDIYIYSMIKDWLKSDNYWLQYTIGSIFLSGKSNL
jgi:hypothetical protein